MYRCHLPLAAQVYTLVGLDEGLKKAYRPATGGKFSETQDSSNDYSCVHIPAAQVYSLVGLEEGLKKAYRSVTEGKFGDALGRFNGLLHLIPLLVVDTRKEVDDVKELISIAKCVFA